MPSIRRARDTFVSESVAVAGLPPLVLGRLEFGLPPRLGALKLRLVGFARKLFSPPESAPATLSKAPGARAAIVLCAVLALFGRGLAAAESPSPRREMPEGEFLATVRRDAIVSSAILPGYYLARLLANWPADLKVAEIGFSNCEIRGDVNLYNNRNEVRVGLSFADVDFDGNIVAPRNTFADDVILRGRTSVKGRLNLEEATFKGSLELPATAVLEKGIHAIGVRFLQRAELSAQFRGETSHFGRAQFHGKTSFDGARFGAGADFGGATFDRATTFQGMSVPAGQEVLFNEGAEFRSTANFASAGVEGRLIFRGVAFGEDLYVTFLNRGRSDPLVGKVGMSGIRCHGRLRFEEARLAEVDLSSGAGPDVGALPNVFEKRAIFQDLRVARADFREAEFLDYVSFYRARFGTWACFDRATFAADVDFRRVEFPSITAAPESGLSLERTKFQRGVALAFEQIREPRPWWSLSEPVLKVKTEDPETWRDLEDVFRRASDLQGANETYYQRQVARVQPKSGAKPWAFLQWVFWGFGVRPWRVTAWIIVVFAAFTTAYWTQIRHLPRSLRSAAMFSFKTAVALDYGRKHTRTTAFAVLTIAEAVLLKVMVFFLLKSLANTLPLVNELISRLIGH